MRALCWHGKGDIRCDTVPDPKIEHPRDAIIKVTACAICGSDLHIYDGVIPTMESGDVARPRDDGRGRRGRAGEQEAEGRRPRRRAVHDLPAANASSASAASSPAASASNPNTEKAAKLWGHSPAGLFGYSHLLGGYAGGQAEYLRVPYADVGPIKVPDGLTDEQVLFLSDIFPTGYMAAEFCNIQPGDTIADLGLRAGRPVRDPQRLPARRRARHRDRHRAGAAGAGARSAAPRRSISWRRTSTTASRS